jgi:hypothetical protein
MGQIEMSFQAYLDNVEEKTGRTPNDFIAEAKSKNLVVHGEIITWLKNDYKLGHGHANAVAHVIKNGATISDKHVGTGGVHSDESNTLRLDGKKK